MPGAVGHFAHPAAITGDRAQCPFAAERVRVSTTVETGPTNPGKGIDCLEKTVAAHGRPGEGRPAAI